MQKVTRTAALLLVAVAGLLLVVAIAISLRKPTPAPAVVTPQRSGSVAVVVAARDLPAGVPITIGDLRIAPLATLPAGGHTSATPLIGKVPTVAIASGTPLTNPLLAEGLALNLQPGERALAIPVDELAGVGNRIAPGDYVDVFLSLKEKGHGTSQQGDDESQSRLLLSHLRVLGYGTRDIDLASPTAETTTVTASQPGGRRATVGASHGGSAGAGHDSETQPRSAVLAVPVEAANRLLLGAQSGKLFLALRHPGDPGLPDESLFPAPRNVLTPRLDLGPGLRDTASTPENAAFAGIDGSALAGRRAAPSAPSARSNHRPASPSIEIIRGGQAGPLSSP
ncbi:MAG: Flp pilus assembly protein CpaB [Pseudomonas sp.]